MRHLFRWAFTVVAGLSLLICLSAAGCLACGVKFDKRSGNWDFQHNDEGVGVVVSEGMIYFVRAVAFANYVVLAPGQSENYGGNNASNKDWHYHRLKLAFRDTTQQVLGPDGTPVGPTRTVGFFEWIQFPLWWMVVIAGILPAIWTASFWSSRVKGWPAGHCPRCGYDLRATPQQCPECGSVVSSPRAFT
jgi:hypothetical protein